MSDVGFRSGGKDEDSIGLSTYFGYLDECACCFDSTGGCDSCCVVKASGVCLYTVGIVRFGLGFRH